MTVLHIYSGNLYGGIEKVLISISRYGGASGDASHQFALCYDDRLARELRDNGGQVHILGRASFADPLSCVKSQIQLMKVLGRNRPDLIIIHSPWVYAMFAGISLLMGLRPVFWLHDHVPRRKLADRLAVLVSPKYILVNSIFTGQSSELLFPAKPYQVLYYPVDVNTAHGISENNRAQLRCQLGASDSDVVIVQVGRLEAYKGHFELIAAAARVPLSMPWQIWIVGGVQRATDQQYLTELRGRAVELGIADRVRFLGQRNDVNCIMNAAEIFCQPNAGPEAFGLVFIEAMHAGVPIVTYGHGSAKELITPNSGILVEPGDVDALASALKRLIASPEDRARHSRGSNNRARELTDPQGQVEKLELILARTSQ